jgi:DNA polymerase III delta subunit
VAALLYAHCVGGEDKVPLSDIAPEIEKIASGMGPQETEVTETHLDSIARKASETFLRRLQDAAGDGDLHQALRALDGALLFKENAPVRIVATLMYRVDRISGSPRARAARRRGLLALAEADRKLKSTPQDPRLVLETALFTLCGVD